jgi:ankyrin repeat protein
METENESKSILTSKDKLRYSLFFSLVVGFATFLNKALTKDVGAALAHSLVSFIFTLPIAYLVLMYFANKAKKDIEKVVQEIDGNRLQTNNNIGVNGFTRLMAAAVNVELDEIKKFISEGDDVNAVDAKGYTALMYAASNGRFASVQLLMAMGADKNIRTSKGNDAFYFADIKNHLEVKKFLAS